MTEPTTDDLLERHVQRIGGWEPVRQDPAAHLHLSLLRDFLRVLQAALDDEGVESGAARRVIDRVIYAEAPQPAMVEQRIAAQKAAERYLRTSR